MGLPEYITVIPGTDDWVLTHDTGCSALAIQAGRLDWDEWFRTLPVVQSLRKGMVAVDAGAFIGDSTRALTLTGAEVWAFEPQCDAFMCLEHNCPDAKVIHLPLGNNSPISMCGGRGGNMGGRWTGPDNLRDGHYTWGHPLDLWFGLIPRLDFVKIDVEGYEPAVLAGMRHHIEVFGPAICIEINIQALEHNGFGLSDVLCHLERYTKRIVHQSEAGLYDLLCVCGGGI